MLLLIISSFLYCAAGTVLIDCPDRVDNKNTLEGLTNSKIYVYLNKATTASIKFLDSDGALPLKIVINCKKGIIKAAAKPKKTWKNMGKGDIFCNPGDDMLVVLKGKQVFINNEIIPFNLLSKPNLTGYHTVVVKGANTVEKIATGECVEYPNSVKTCDEANQFYREHSFISAGGLYKDGFLDGDHLPNCALEDSNLFGSYQITQGYDIICSDEDGKYDMSTKTPIQHTVVNSFIHMCDNTTH